MRLGFLGQVREFIDRLRAQQTITWQEREKLINRGSTWVRLQMTGNQDWETVSVDEEQYFSHLLADQPDAVRKRFAQRFNTAAAA